MKKNYFLICLTLLFTGFTSFSQVLYENNTSAGQIYNSGLGTGDKPIILFDDINVPVSRINGADSLGITLLKIGVGRSASAPAVTVKIYITNIDPAATSFDSLPAVPPVFLTSFDLPAAGTSTLLTVGDSINPFYKFKTDTGYVFTGYQTFFVGVSFSSSDVNNGWIFSTGPDISEDVAFEYDSSNLITPRSAFNFGGPPGNPAASFYALVYGKQIFASTTPLTLKDFNVTKKNRQNVVTWKTETESNTSVFEIERSKDGIAFNRIGGIKAAGNSNTPLNYQFIDNTPNYGINYYRLRTIDKNNSMSFSMIKNVKNEAVTAFTLYPNPVISAMKVDINSAIRDNGFITLTDIGGRLVYNRQISLLEGNNTFDIDMKNLAPGAYAVKIKMTNDTIIKKITKK